MRREIKEEANLEIENIEFIGIAEDEQEIFFEEGFVKRWRLIFINYKAEVQGRSLEPTAGDDAKEVKWVAAKNLKRYKLSKVTEKLLKKLKII